MKHIASAFAIFLTSFALISCGGKKEEGASTPVEETSSISHTEIGDGVIAETVAMMKGMSQIKDTASAEAFAATVPTIKAKMKDYLKAAQALPAPTAEEKAAFDKKMKAAQEEAGPAMMAMMMGMSQNPEAEAIGKIMEGVMDDKEMDEAMETLESIYAVEDTEDTEAPTAE